MEGKKFSKERFSSRRSIVAEYRRRKIDAFGGMAIPHDDYHLILEDMVAMSVRRHGRHLPMLKLQGEMLTDLSQYEDAVSVYREKLKELKDQNAPQEDIEYVEKELEKYRNLYDPTLICKEYL